MLGGLAFDALTERGRGAGGAAAHDASDGPRLVRNCRSSVDEGRNRPSDGRRTGTS